MRKLVSTFCLSAGMLLTSGAHAGDVKVLSAVVKNKTIDGAQVIWQHNGMSSQRATTSASGVVSYPSGIADNADTSMIITKPGYSTLVVKCPCDDLTYALSPEMTNLDGLRVVLTWGRYPADLDSHIAYPGNHIFFSHKTGTDANLDVDDTSSYGPETITVTRQHAGERYVYAVNDYSDNGKKSSTKLSFSDARVQVYVGKTLIRTYRVQPDVTATNWVVFGIDGDGAFHDINEYLNLSNNGLAQHLRDMVNRGEFTDHTVISNSVKRDAKRMNTRGEKLYHQQHYEDAMYAFQDAINLYPSYGQAYSNLGLTYSKLSRNAESLWANRKAIELASGANKSRVQASSYYNIARMYEKAGHWQQALDSYRKAKALRANSAYDQGIGRMEARLSQ